MLNKSEKPTKKFAEGTTAMNTKEPRVNEFDETLAFPTLVPTFLTIKRKQAARPTAADLPPPSLDSDTSAKGNNATRSGNATVNGSSPQRSDVTIGADAVNVSNHLLVLSKSNASGGGNLTSNASSAMPGGGASNASPRELLADLLRQLRQQPTSDAIVEHSTRLFYQIFIEFS